MLELRIDSNALIVTDFQRVFVRNGTAALSPSMFFCFPVPIWCMYIARYTSCSTVPRADMMYVSPAVDLSGFSHRFCSRLTFDTVPTQCCRHLLLLVTNLATYSTAMHCLCPVTDGKQMNGSKQDGFCLSGETVWTAVMWLWRCIVVVVCEL